MTMTVDIQRRARRLNDKSTSHGPVAYWMSRDQRAQDNWALLYAQELALERRQSLLVVFNLLPQFLQATWRQYHFMLRGLRRVEEELRRYQIPFLVTTGQPETEIPRFAKRHGIGTLVTDFSPLRINQHWYDQISKSVDCEFWQVDTHNIIPCWEASDKREYAAYTFRPRVHKQLDDYLTEFPSLQKHPHPLPGDNSAVDWRQLETKLKVDRSVGPIEDVNPGSDAAIARLKRFLKSDLAHYDELRNNPNNSVQTGLSPYLHFGHIAPQRVAWEVQREPGSGASREALLEQLIVRRELSDNFCYYCQEYDSFDAFPDWAKETLTEHQSDPREYVYSGEELEQGKTHDPLWNAAQENLVARGTMHGYLRMYWAKKILQWSLTPQEALTQAIYLNDRYQLDGRDPNGYTGIAWSIGGVHDRPWFEREVFGKIRYMSYNGCRRKFDVEEYIANSQSQREDT